MRRTDRDLLFNVLSAEQLLFFPLSTLLLGNKDRFLSAPDTEEIVHVKTNISVEASCILV